MAVQKQIDKERAGESIEEPEIAAIAPEPAPEPKAEPEVPPEIAELKAQLEAERAARKREEAARAAAEADAGRYRDSAASQQQTLHDAHLTAVSRAIEATESKLGSLKQSYAVAMQNGDYAALADIQVQMASEAARKFQLESGKAQLEQQRSAPQPQMQNDQFTPRTRAWLDKHPDVLSDRRSQLRAAAAHNEALADGHIQDSDAYFDFIEQKLGYKQAQQTPAAPPQQQRQPSYAAAPSRPEGGANRVTNAKELKMTPHMRELAKMAGMSDAEWAKEYLAAVERGDMQPIH